MTDILLLNPPQFDTTPYGKIACATSSPSLGTAIIASVLQRAGFDVSAHDLYYVPWDQVQDLLIRESPRVVGVSCFSDQRGAAFRLARLLKSINPSTRVVLGGPHPTFMYQQILSDLPVDVCVLNEGEMTFLELVQRWADADWTDDPSCLEGVRGIAYAGAGDVCVGPQRAWSNNLDDLPFPAYHFYQDCAYKPWWGYKQVRGLERVGSDLRFLSVVASRGCPFTCAFCSTPNAWGRRWRHRSAKNFVDEIEFASSEYKYEWFNFADDIFTINQKWSIEVCREIVGRGLQNRIAFDCETRVDCVSAELLSWLRRAGCVFVSYGVESFSDQVLTAINKRQTQERIEKAILMTHDAGLDVEFLLMVGNPGESQSSIDETRRFIEKHKPAIVSPAITEVMPGTDLYQRAKAEGFIDDDYWLRDDPAPYYTVEHGEEQLKSWYWQIKELNRTGIDTNKHLIRPL